MHARLESRARHQRAALRLHLAHDAGDDLRPRHAQRRSAAAQARAGARRFRSGELQSELLWAPARDGERVPVSVVYRKDTPIDGTAPLYQYGYGSYGLSVGSGVQLRAAVAARSRLRLRDRARARRPGAAAAAGTRPAASDASGTRSTISSTSPNTSLRAAMAREDKVFAAGGSAGGLLMGAIANAAPEHYRGIVAHVPFVDVVTTMLDESDSADDARIRRVGQSARAAVTTNTCSRIRRTTTSARRPTRRCW